MKNVENCIEFLTGEKTMTLSVTNPKHINRLRKLHEKNPSCFDYLVQNSDGSICCRLPLSWLKITPPTKKELTEEEKQNLRQRLAEIRNR